MYLWSAKVPSLAIGMSAPNEHYRKMPHNNVHGPRRQSLVLDMARMDEMARTDDLHLSTRF
jgi:hypothetical protein